MDSISDRERKEAEDAGMSVEKYRIFQVMKAANDIQRKKQIEKQEAEAAERKSKEEEETKRNRAVKMQRDVLAVICVVLFSVVILLSFDGRGASEAADNTDIHPQEALISYNAPYVASKNSDKYHKQKCDFVKNILTENRVYYETEAEAERDGKTPCSVCKP